MLLLNLIYILPMCLKTAGQAANRLYCDQTWYSAVFYHVLQYSQTSMAQTSLGPWKFVRDMGSSSH